jgi:hypothetical protein
VVTKRPNYKTIRGIINFANKNKFTHIRLVSDLLDLKNATPMERIRWKLRGDSADDKLVIYQGRKEFEKGTKECYISLLKPVITPSGKIVACCGWQYRHENPSRDYDETDYMCDAKNIDKLYNNQNHYDGSGCAKCYYMNYNSALKTLLSEIRHKEFI